jgi:hypothetical protein
MSARDLSAALATLGIQCEIEEKGQLAVIIPAGHLRLDARTRRAIVAVAKAHGFTNVCLELSPDV